MKRFVIERGSTALDRLVRREDVVATATVAYAEAYAGLTRRRRDGSLSAAGYARACRHFERDWSGLLRVELSPHVLERAREVIQRRGLRGFDGIHLASALVLQTELHETLSLVGADDRLLRAAEAEGMTVIDIEAV